LDVVRVLLAHNGSSVTCTDFTGRSPLHLAAAENNLEIMNLLIYAGAMTSPKCSFIQQLNFTVGTDSTYRFKEHKYLSVKDESEYLTDICTCDHTPVVVASRFGHIESARMLLRLDGSAATQKDCDGASLIHIAACHGHHHFIRWIIHFIRDTNINSPSENGSTPLHSAAYCGQYKEVKLLIADGANAGALDNNNMTALHYIALNAGNMKVIPSLSCSGNDTKHSEIYFSNEHVTVWKQKDNNEYIYVYHVMSSCPLPKNCTFQELVHMDNNCRTLVELLNDLNHPFDINAKDYTGRTVLELSVMNGLQCIIVEILKNISNTQARDMIRESSIDLILNKTHFETKREEKERKRERESVKR
jgi:ankyrin repeat protein